MAFVEITEAILVDVGGGTLRALSDVSVQVLEYGTLDPVPVYADDAGAVPLVQPLRTRNGNIDGYVAEGRYVLRCTFGDQTWDVVYYGFDPTQHDFPTDVATLNSRVDTVEASIVTLQAHDTTDKGFVYHGADPNVARPAGYVSVEWVGSVTPVNAVDGDTWVDTTLAPAGGVRLLRGVVAANGATVNGTGFGVVKTGTGLYSVTFDAAFPATPVVVVGGVPYGASSYGLAYPTVIDANHVTVLTMDLVTRAATDIGFSFIVAAA